VAGEGFGTSVAINDVAGPDRMQIIAGAPGRGRIHIYALETPSILNSWRRVQTIIDPTITQFSILSTYRLGEQLAIDQKTGLTFAATAPTRNTALTEYTKAIVNVYKRNTITDVWYRDHREVITDFSRFTEGRIGIAVDGPDRIFIGYPARNTYNSSFSVSQLYVIERSPHTGQWIERSLFTSSEPVFQGFGATIAVYNDDVMVGAYSAPPPIPGVVESRI
jgi:hypothetical protein